MSLAIYRKYRPQKWSDLVNQNHLKVTLQNEIASDKVAHAYIFTGPRGVGKTTAARLLAKTINCQGRKAGATEPCGKCDSCLELTAGNDLDILEIDAASHTGVDNVRENIIANARFTPVKRKYKVFIIDEVHMLSISAFNALLKILEEPPTHTIFILATTEIHKVPATIISRCQRFDFKKVNAEELKNRLAMICQAEGVNVHKEVLADIARHSEGCLRDAESLLGQILSLGEKEITQAEASLIIPSSNLDSIIELVRALILLNAEAGITLINKLVEDGIDLVQFSDELVEFLRRLIIIKISGNLKSFAFDLDEDNEKIIIELAQKFELNGLLKLINLFMAKRGEIKTAVLSQLPLEIAVIEYCQKIEAPKAEKNNPEPPKSNLPPPNIETKTKPDIKPDVQKSGESSTTLKSAILPSKGDKTKNIRTTLDEIKEKWHNFLVQLQDCNASLVFILKIAEPLELVGNVLKVGFKYDFHQQRVNQAKIKESLEKVMADFFGEQLVLETCLLSKDYQSEFINQQTQHDEVELVDELPKAGDSIEQQALIDTLVKTFNGKVVE